VGVGEVRGEGLRLQSAWRVLAIFFWLLVGPIYLLPVPLVAQKGLGFRVWGVGARVQGLGSRV
jgi:hypothetical protein